MSVESLPLPGSKLAREQRQPGHWLLASLGKRVLRPGGVELTRWMLARLAVCRVDRVVEFAPGMGVTARLTLANNPREYTAIEPDPVAHHRLAKRLKPLGGHCVEAGAESTGLPSTSYTAVYGEAMLSMQTPEKKRRIVAEAARLLQPGGRYGIHELCLPDLITPDARRELQRDMSTEIHVGVQPVTGSEWRELLEQAGFRVQAERRVPMALLEPRRLLQDEGWLGVARIGFNLLRRPMARRRVCRMRQLFHRHKANLEAISLVAIRLG